MERTCSISLDATRICNLSALTPKYHLNSVAFERLVKLIKTDCRVIGEVFEDTDYL